MMTTFSLRLALTALMLTGIASSAAADGSLLWTNDLGQVWRINTDGSCPEMLTDGLGLLRGVDVDESTGKMYFASFVPASIRRSDLDGANVEDLVTTGQVNPNGLELDKFGKVYWMDVIGSVRRTNLDGTAIETVYTTPGGNFVDPRDVTLDTAGGKMYFTAVRGVGRVNLDGTGFESLYEELSGPATRPWSVELDVANGHMYWTARTNSMAVRRADLDGSNVTEIVTGLSDPRGLALDLGAGKIYWVNVGTASIQSSNLDGSDVQTVVSGLSSPEDLAFYADAFGSCACGTFTDVGSALAGTNGLPVLTGTGDLCESMPVSIELTNALAGTMTTLIAGISELNISFKGGTLVPSLEVVLDGVTDGSGTRILAGTWPAGVPSGTMVWLQEWMVDAGGPNGFAASNALRIDID